MAWGYWTVFVCLIIMTVAALTGSIPLDLQPLFILLVFGTMIIGGIIGVAGYFKSLDRKAYPVVLAILLVPAILVVIYYLITR